MLCSQVPVDVPCSLGVNLAVEGASLRPSRAWAQKALASPSHSDPSAQQRRRIQRPSSLEGSKVSGSCRSGKERRSKKRRGNKKRQTASAAPENRREQSAGGHETACARRSLRQPVQERPLVKSNRNLESLAPNASKAALTPFNLSLFPTPHHSTSQSQRTQGRRSHISGSVPLSTAVQQPSGMSAPLHPPRRLPLPALEVLPYPLM